MLRSILVAMATAATVSRARGVARQTAYGAIATFALMVALVFLAIAVFYFLLQSFDPAIAAAIVAGGFALFAFIIFLWAWARQKHPADDDWMEQLGLPAVTGVDSKDVHAIVDRAKVELRKAGPVKISLVALAVGFLIARLK